MSDRILLNSQEHLEACQIIDQLLQLLCSMSTHPNDEHILENAQAYLDSVGYE